MCKKEKDWFRLKRYPHIGLPILPSDRKWIEEYITNRDKIANHSFLPFIHKTSKVRKFRKEYLKENGEKVKNDSSGKSLRKGDEKKRELYYASHFDSLIFSYYAQILSNYYDKKLKSPAFQLDDVISAYRSIPVDPNNEESPNKCNIDFANDVFKFILNYEESEFVVVAFDISSFFDNLKHDQLRQLWAEVIGHEKLPPDHFNVYKNITRFSHVDIVDIFEEFKDRIYTRKIDKDGKLLPIVRKKVHSIKYLRNQNAIAFCKKQEFLKVKGKLLQPSKKKYIDGKTVNRDFGIPQGSPISSILANIYLLGFDKNINGFVSKNGGIYRRYSDDIIVVCPLQCKEELLTLVNSEIEKCKLIIQDKKTQIFHFKRKDDRLICGQEFTSTINWNKNLIYLGFEFDGQHVLLKSASLSGYYRKMKRSIRRHMHFASRFGSKTKGELFKNRIFKKFSYKGAGRRRKYLWSKKENKFIKSDFYNWGNFLSYVDKASGIMKNGEKIKGQTKRHWNILNSLIKGTLLPVPKHKE